MKQAFLLVFLVESDRAGDRIADVDRLDIVKVQLSVLL
jgi:hypothetical protein